MIDCSWILVRGLTSLSIWNFELGVKGNDDDARVENDEPRASGSSDQVRSTRARSSRSEPRGFLFVRAREP